jgi:hypothetical protein
MVDWTRLVQHEGCQETAFEELCYQLFDSEYNNQGECRRVRAPDGGLEAYLERPDGTVVGIQSKFFRSGKIKTTQFKKSLFRALTQWPRLQECILAMHLNPTKKEWGSLQNLKDSLRKDINAGRAQKWYRSGAGKGKESDSRETLKARLAALKITHWTHSTIDSLLSKPKMVGKKAWFFGELELNLDWFKNYMYTRLAGLSSKYLPDLHVSGESDRAIKHLVGDAALADEIDELVKDLPATIKAVKLAMSALKKSVNIDKHKRLCDALQDKVDAALGRANAFHAQARVFLRHLRDGSIGEAQKVRLEDRLEESVIGDFDHKTLWGLLDSARYDWTAVIDESLALELRVAHDLGTQKPYRVVLEKGKSIVHVDLSPHVNDTMAQNLHEALKEAAPAYSAVPREKMIKLLVAFRHFVSEKNRMRERVGELEDAVSRLTALHVDIVMPVERFQRRKLGVSGAPGIGKTHLLCKACEERIGGRKPALLIFSSRFRTSAPLSQQFAEQLELGSSFSWQQIVGALETAGQVYRGRVLVAIDALNESPVWDTVVKEQLPEVVAQLSRSPWLAVAVTCRQSYAQELLATGFSDAVYHLRSDESIDEYRRAYLSHFKVKFKNVPPAVRRQLENRFFVTLIARTYGNEKASSVQERNLVDIDITDVFDNYLKKVDHAVCARMKAPTGLSLTRKKLLGLAERLWLANTPHLGKTEAISVLDGVGPAEVRTADSWTYSIVHEGLLLDFNWGGGEEVVEFSHQRLGEYLMACHLLQDKTKSQVQAFLRKSQKHPRAHDVFEMVSVLVPKLFGNHLFQIVGTPTAILSSAQEGALFEMSPKYIDAAAEKWLTRRFRMLDTRHRWALFSKLSYCAHFRDCPFNAQFTDRVLRTLNMPDRDVAWSEWLRSESSLAFRDVEYLETESRKEAVAEKPPAHLMLMATFVSWFLTSTDRRLRDLATRALYYFGCKFPHAIFSLAEGSLPINDPYVPERLLAASYGVSMAIHCRSCDRGSQRDELASFVETLYGLMFKRGAVCATTHVLMRDYASRTIDLALMHHPNLLSERQQARTRPPFKDGGIRRWLTSEDRDEGKYREGNSPLGINFRNYTLGRLVPDRRNYDDGHIGYQRVVGNVLWRIYSLGYSLDKFGEIDKQISRFNWQRTHPGKIERYGKKYAWIAYFELAGCRHDRGLLGDRYDEGIADRDIDPSFPDPPSKSQIVKSDFLGDRRIPTPTWIVEGDEPDTTPYVAVKRICNSTGPWVLLNAYVDQRDANAKRAAFLFLRGLLIRKSRLRSLLKACERVDPISVRILPEPEEDHYTFAGEIPWCETFPYQTRQALRIVTGSRTIRVPREELRLEKDGHVLSDVELQQVVEILRDLRGDDGALERRLVDYRLKVVKLKSLTDEVVERTRDYDVELPLRCFSWESSHSFANPRQWAHVPSKELCRFLYLRSEPQTFDMFDPQGGRASITLQWGEPFHTYHEVLYLRQDLLDRYLRGKELALVWFTFGERQFRSDDMKECDEFAKKHTYFKRFHAVRGYRPLRKPAGTKR